MSWKTIYLTGAPAAGKSTLIHRLAKALPNVRVFEYGRAMSERLSALRAGDRRVSQEMLRGGTDRHVSQADIDEVDAGLAFWVEQHRSSYHLIIDSHHVTIEDYGFRIAPFSPAKLAALRIDEFWVLIVDGTTTGRRIAADPKGRPTPTSFRADFHTFLQASLATHYAAQTGRPVYVLDGSMSEEEVMAAAMQRLK
jgi:adenylate kinase